jgi:hypothetical protein
MFDNLAPNALHLDYLEIKIITSLLTQVYFLGSEKNVHLYSGSCHY